MPPEPGDRSVATTTPEPLPPPFEATLVRACVLAMWADQSMAAVERDALRQVVDAAAPPGAEREDLLHLVLQDLNPHQILADVERLEPEQKLHLFDRCLDIATRDRAIGPGERRFLTQLRRRCGASRVTLHRALLRHSVSYRLALLAVVASPLLVLAAVAAIVGGGEASDAPTETADHPALLLPAPPAQLVVLEPTKLYDEVRRSVVTVLVRRAERPTASGSGAVIGMDAGRQSYYVVTNRHVVELHEGGKGTLSYEVEFENGARFQALLDYYARDRDLALLRVLGVPLWAAPVPLRLRSTLSVGEDVYALGSPLGLRHTFTAGVISALRPDQIQTDATVHAGSSGGPLFDAHGLLCGVVTSGHPSKDLSFALYADSILAMLQARNRAAAAGP